MKQMQPFKIKFTPILEIFFLINRLLSSNNWNVAQSEQPPAQTAVKYPHWVPIL